MLLTLDAHQITILLYIIDFRRPPNNNITYVIRLSDYQINITFILLTLDAHQITILLYVITLDDYQITILH